ncbi:DUF732 domain-containing protein [Mycolicibacterium sp. HS_4_1]
MKPARSRLVQAVAGVSIGLTGVFPVAPAAADDTAYLVNVTVRPGYNFGSAAQALEHGHRVCDTIEAGKAYAHIVAGIEADFATDDEFQAAYLISQAANELCPADIWQLRQSAAGYRVPAPRKPEGTPQ